MHYLIIVNNIHRKIKFDQNHDHIPFLTNDKITHWFSILRENENENYLLLSI